MSPASGIPILQGREDVSREHGPQARAPALVARMRCRSRPTSAEWIDNPQGGALGTDYPPKKRVPVVGSGTAGIAGLVVAAFVAGVAGLAVSRGLVF